MSTDTFDYSVIALVVAISTAIGVILAALASIRSANTTKNIGYAQIMESFENNIQKTLSQDKKLAKVGDPSVDINFCDGYATDFLNTLDRLAFLRNENKIDDKMIKFFKPFLSYGLTLLEWKKKTHGKNYENEWSDIVKLCKNKNIEKENFERLPPQLKYFAEYYENKRKKRNEKNPTEEKND